MSRPVIRLGAATEVLECLVARTLDLVLVLALRRFLGQIGSSFNDLAAGLPGLGALKGASYLWVPCRGQNDLAEFT
jgi:hypothetical protein